MLVLFFPKKVTIITMAIMQKKRINTPLTLITALLVVLIAGLAGSTLVVLRRIHGKSAHEAAAEVVIRQGQAMVSQLSSQPSVISSSAENADWSEFSRLVQNLHSLEKGLQYVSVVRDDVVLFHEQTRLLDGTPSSHTNLTGAVEMRRELLHVGKDDTPVVVFSTTVDSPNASSTRVSVALRKDTVNREEHATNTAITSMFRLTLLTVVISFTISLLLVVWMMRREVKREALRRKEEHLAFSGMLANGIVHDFRNPMSSMRLDVQMLIREAEKDDAASLDRLQQLATRTRNTLDRMDKVFKEFLYVSRPDSGKQTSLDLVACTKDSLDMLAPRFEQARIEVRLDASPTPITIFVFEASLRRALANVLTNAEQFSPPEETIDVHLHVKSETTTLEISDHGPGIPKTERKKVFDMFFTTRPSGTGLGLFLAKAAVERSGGTINITDNHDGSKGTCINITFPIAKHGTTHNHNSRPNTDANAETGTRPASKIRES